MQHLRKPGNPTRHARCGDALSAQFCIVVSCGDIAYSCNVECLFRRYCDELLRLHSFGELTLTGTGRAPPKLFSPLSKTPESKARRINVAARCDIDSNHRDDFETT